MAQTCKTIAVHSFASCGIWSCWAIKVSLVPHGCTSKSSLAHCRWIYLICRFYCTAASWSQPQVGLPQRNSPTPSRLCCNTGAARSKFASSSFKGASAAQAALNSTTAATLRLYRCNRDCRDSGRPLPELHRKTFYAECEQRKRRIEPSLKHAMVTMVFACVSVSPQAYSRCAHWAPSVPHVTLGTV